RLRAACPHPCPLVVRSPVCFHQHHHRIFVSILENCLVIWLGVALHIHGTSEIGVCSLRIFLGLGSYHEYHRITSRDFFGRMAKSGNYFLYALLQFSVTFSFPPCPFFI